MLSSSFSLIRSTVLFVGVLAVLLAFNSLEVQSKPIKPLPRQKQLTASSRSSKESKSGKHLDKTPMDMQLDSTGVQIRRFMWPEIEESVDNLMHGMTDGVHVVQRMIGARNQKVKNLQRLQPVASTLIKYIIKSPLKKKFRQPPSFNRPIKNRFPKALPANHFPSKSIPEDYKIFEALALREWEKGQKNSEGFDSETTPDQVIVGNVTSLDGWKPVTKFGASLPSLKYSQPLSELHTNIKPFVLSEHTQNSYDVTENSAEETVQITQRYKKPSKTKDTEVVQLTTEESPNYPEFFIKKFKSEQLTSTPSTLALSDDRENFQLVQRISPRSPVASSTSQNFVEEKNSRKNEDTLQTKGQKKNRIRSQNLYSPKNPSDVSSRGTVKFGDRL